MSRHIFLPPERPDPRDVPALRLCLRCRRPFDSAGFGERICSRCKTARLWHDGPGVASRPTRGGPRRLP